MLSDGREIPILSPTGSEALGQIRVVLGTRCGGGVWRTLWPHRLLVGLAWLALSWPAAGPAADGWAALADTVFVTLGLEQALPHPVVTALAQDHNGFLWVGTQGGLVRFDGNQFDSFAASEDDPKALLSPVIAELTTDVDGRLWVASIAGDIARYDDENDEFERFPAEPGQTRGSVTAMIGDGRRGVWVASSTGLEHIDGDRHHLSRFRQAANGHGELPGTTITALARQQGDGSLWVATDLGLARLAPTSQVFVPVPIYDLGSAPLSDPIASLAEDSEGVLWFVTEHSAVGRIEARPGTAAIGREIFDLAATSRGGPGSSRLIEGRAGELWIGRTASGITVLTPKTGVIRQLAPRRGIGTSLADGMIRALFKDRSGRIWAGTNRGVSRTDPGHPAIETILSVDHPRALKDENILAVTFDRAGQVWLGLKDHGLARIDPAAGTMDAVVAISGGISSLAVAADGMLWAGSYDGQTVTGLDPVSGSVRQKLVAKGVIGSIRSILPSHGRLWLASGALIDLDPTTRQSQVYRHGDAPDTPNDDTVDMILSNADDQLWLGTRRGLDLFSPVDGHFRHFIHDATDSASLPGPVISSLLTDRRGRLWVGTLGNGIGVSAEPQPADGTAPRFRRLTSSDGLPSDNIGGILEDSIGRLWVSTANGLAVIDPDSLKVRPLQFAEGVAISAYWVGAAARSAAHDLLLFGGSGGLTVVHPDRLGDTPHSPQVVVTAIHVDGQAVNAGAYRNGQSLTLTPQQHSLTVDFAAPDSQAPERLRYHYRLDGFDDVGQAWTEVDSKHRSASYINLPPGSYRLLLRSSIDGNPWSDAVTLAITIQPAWWQTPWVTVLVMAIGLIAITLLVQGRTFALRRRSRLLEDLVERQTRALTEANDHLRELASTDPLTALLNRRAFTDLAQRELDRCRRGHPLPSFLMIDIDHFKRVNDTYGHAAGDAVLISVGHHIGAVLRGTDLVARLGGEELAVLLPETEPGGALIMAEKLRLAVAEAVHLTTHPELLITVSVGVATLKPAETLATLSARADEMLYVAKHSGRNRIVTDQPIAVDLAL